MNDIVLKIALVLTMIILEMAVQAIFLILGFEIMIRPDFLLVLVVYFGFNYGSMTAQVSGFIGGAFQDVAANILGPHMLTLVIIGYIAGQLRRRLYIDNPLAVLSLIAGAVTLKVVILMVIYFFSTSTVEADQSLWDTYGSLLISGVLTLILGPPIFLLLRRLNKELHRSAINDVILLISVLQI